MINGWLIEVTDNLVKLSVRKSKIKTFVFDTENDAQQARHILRLMAAVDGI